MLALVLILCAAAPAQEQEPQPRTDLNLPVETFSLDNGMRFVVVPRHQVPRAFCSLWWRVGCVNERPGITGISHFLEHMMSMGTATIGTKDAARDAELNGKIDLRAMEAERRGVLLSDEIKERRNKLVWQSQEIVNRQKEITIQEHLSKIYQANGGINLNASTSFDRTNYYVELPSNKIELFFWMESDRFAGPVFRNLYSERDVVLEERRTSTESTPAGLIFEAYWASLWQAHPYSWPIIGWTSDIEQYDRAKVRDYFRTYYSPDNCTAVIVGDVETEQVRSLAQKYFARLKPFPGVRPPVITQEPKQTAERRMHAEADAQPAVVIRWHGPSGVHRDTAALDLLMEVFHGRTGRLYRPLVEQKKLALGIAAWYWSLRHGGVVNITARPAEKIDPALLEKAMLAIVDDVRENGVTERELEKVRNKVLADLVRGMSTYEGIAEMVGYLEMIGSVDDLKTYVRRLNEAGVDDLKRCAQTYLTDTGRNVLILTRRETK
jgi:predicted Zn-dependent peptidase